MLSGQLRSKKGGKKGKGGNGGKSGEQDPFAFLEELCGLTPDDSEDLKRQNDEGVVGTVSFTFEVGTSSRPVSILFGSWRSCSVMCSNLVFHFGMLQVVFPMRT